MTSRWHTPALLLFLAINLTRVTEHIVQAIQICWGGHGVMRWGSSGWRGHGSSGRNGSTIGTPE